MIDFSARRLKKILRFLIFSMFFFIEIEKIIFRKTKSQSLPQCYIYAGLKDGFIIFAFSVPKNAVKVPSNFVKSPMGEISLGRV